MSYKSKYLLSAVVVGLVVGLPIGVATYLSNSPERQCQKNLQHIGAAVSVYTSDFDGWFPPVADNTRESNLNNRWYAGDPQSWQNILLPYVKDRRTFVCPASADHYVFAPNLTPKKYGTFDGRFALFANNEPSTVWLQDKVDSSGPRPVTAHGTVCFQLKVDGQVVARRDD